MKRIITCSDGTWNRPNSKDKDGKSLKTNVQKIFDCIEKREKRTSPLEDIIQIKYYDEGIGAQGGLLSRVVNGATGKGIDINILDVYKFICWNYEVGDEIYLFGFSRGAYTARSVAGLIRKCGIIKTNNLDLIAQAYTIYRDKGCKPDDSGPAAFRKENSHEISNLKFIGVWDTVGSLGVPLLFFELYNKKKYSFYDTTLSTIVENAYHALAVDERRGNFSPTLWQKNKEKDTSGQKLEQRWFAGVHSNIGGGYPDAGLSDIALKWLFEKAEVTGLCIDGGYKNLPMKYDAELYNSAKGIYSMLPKVTREIIIDNKESFIDESVYKRMELMGDKYQPENVKNAKTI